MFALLGLVTLLYAAHFDNSFHFDDSHTIVNNPAIRDLANWPRILTDATAFSVLPSNQGWRPLVTLSLALDYRLAGGLHPWAFHLDAFAAFLALLVGFFMLTQPLLTGKRALLATAILGLHPVLAETVNYAIQRGDLYACLGWTWGLCLFARANPAWPIPFVLACLSKPTALAFPMLLLAYMLCVQGQFRWRPLLLALALALALAALHRHFTPATFRTGGPPMLPYWWTQPAIVCFYLITFFVPYHLVADTDWSCFPTPFSGPALAGHLGLISLLSLALWAHRRQHSPLAFGLAWFLLGLSLTSLTPLAEVTNDHRMCLAYPGLVLAFVYCLPTSTKGWPILLMWLTALGWQTWQRNQVWDSEESLWLEVTQKSPASGRGWMNYGLTQLKAARWARAGQALERAVQLTPNYPLAHINLGICKAAQGQLSQAEACFQKAETLAPSSPEVPYYRARWLCQADPVQARILLRKALKLRSQYTEAWLLLCQIDSQAQDWPALRTELAWAQALPDYRPLLPPVQRNAAAQMAAELTRCQTRLQQTPNPEAYIEYSFALWKQDRMQDSLQAADQGLRRYPAEPRLHNNRAAALLALARWSEAAQSAQTALQLQPDFSLARNNLRYAQSQANAHSQGLPSVENRSPK